MRNQKGGIILSDTGFIQARVYTSYAQIPLQGAAITVTAPDGTALAMRITNRSGEITPIELVTPSQETSQSPEESAAPFTTVNLRVEREGYEEIFIRNLQVFSGTVTQQDLEMIPLSEFPEDRNKSETFNTPPQNL